jgi:hypothetical protein
VGAHPEKNIENGLEVMAKVMAEFLAIAQHDFESHEWWSPLEIKKFDVRVSFRRKQKFLQFESRMRVSAQMMPMTMLVLMPMTMLVLMLMLLMLIPMAWP